MKDKETWDDRYDLMNKPYLRYGVVTTTANWTAGVDGPEAVILFNAAGGTVTLPLAANKRHAAFYIKKIAGGAALTIARSGADLIDGAVSQSLAAQYDAMLVVSDGGTNWFIIGIGP